jgi:hypothetical protein
MRPSRMELLGVALVLSAVGLELGMIVGWLVFR